MRPTFKTFTAVLALFVSTPLFAAIGVSRSGGYMYATWPGYLDGRSFASFDVRLTQDLAEKETRVVSLADVSQINVYWAVEMRRYPFGLEKDYQTWQAGLADVDSFSASLINVLGTIRIQTFELTTRNVAPRLATPGFGASFINFSGDGFTFTDGVGRGDGWVIGVPEPGIWAMMLAGFGLIGAAARRRQNVATTYA